MSNPLFPAGYRGLGDSRWSGMQGSVAESVGIDAHSTPGLIKVHQKLTKESGDVVNELCKARISLSDGSRLWFSSETGKIWREVSGTYTLINTTVFPAYDIRTAYTTGKSDDVSVQVSIPTSVKFKPDGLTMYVCANAKVSGNNGEIFQYTLTTAWDVSTASYASKKFNADTDGAGLFFKPDGTKMFVSEDNGGTLVIAYNLSTAWDVSTATAAGETFNFGAQGGRGWDLAFSTDGTKMVIFDADTYEVNEYTLGTAWNVSTATFVQAFDLPLFTNGAAFKSDGTRFWINTSANGGTIKQYSLATAWNVSTAVDDGVIYNQGNQQNFGLAVAENGSNLYIGTQSGPETIYQYSLSAADTAVATLDAVEFENDVYFAVRNRLMKVPVANIATFAGLTNVGNFIDPEDGPRPMIVRNLQLYIGNGQNVSQVNELGSWFQTTDFTVKAPEIITALGPYDIDLLVGTQIGNGGRVLRWDTFSPSWTAEDFIPEKGITAFLADDNFTFAFAGNYGRLYFYDGERLILDKRVRGTWNTANKAIVNLNATGYLNGLPVFGLSTVAGTPCKMGVYSYGGYSQQYPRILDLAFPKGTTFNSIYVGCVLIEDTDLRVAFNDGIYKLDATAKYENAHIETRQLTPLEARSSEQTYIKYMADYVSLPANTGITFSYRDKYANGFTALTPMTDVEKEQVRSELTVGDVTSLQLRIDFVVSGNNAPEVENIAVE